MWRYNMDEELMTLLESLYGPATSAVLHEGEIGQSFRTSGVSTEEIRTRVNLATSTIARLKKMWNNNNIKAATNIRLYKSQVVSVLTYGCESWTLKAGP